MRSLSPQRRWASVALSLVAMTTMAQPPAFAQARAKCAGETWAALAEKRYGDGSLAKLLAARNKRPEDAHCEEGGIVRFPSTIHHTVRAGQTIEAIWSLIDEGMVNA